MPDEDKNFATSLVLYFETDNVTCKGKITDSSPVACIQARHDTMWERKLRWLRPSHDTLAPCCGLPQAFSLQWGEGEGSKFEEWLEKRSLQKFAVYYIHVSQLLF